MNKGKTAVIAAASAAVVAVCAAAAVKFGGDKPTVPAMASSSAVQSEKAESTAYSAAEEAVSELHTEEQSVTEKDKKAESTTAGQSATAQGEAQSESTSVLETVLSTVKETTEKITRTITEGVKCTPSDISSSFVLPKANKYISRYPNIDFDSINLASYKYNAEGNYFYTDDKECWQDNFGYNLVYDKLAAVGHMYFDTIRTVFNYGGKQWLVQLWKGQYGYVFVGAEMGVYTREIGSKGAYKCADKEDWLFMEMTCFWDQRDDGNFVPVFTRPYTEYWWCTGFVPGWLNNTKKCTELQLVGRITFKDADMARSFANAMQRSGFDERSSYSFSAKDSITVIGRDVVFTWWKLDDEQ